MSGIPSRTILTIAGSLRQHSFNKDILRAIAASAPAGVSFSTFEGLDTLPHFNPDITEIPAPVQVFREMLHAADGVIICTPEYAFGVPGSLKNALDWVVSTGEFNQKPVAAISASPLASGGDKALAALLHTLTALGTRMTAASSLSIPMVKKKINELGEVTDLATQQALEGVLGFLLEDIRMI